MPMSKSRSTFYKEIYFPAVYYKEVFDITLEEVGDEVKAQQELKKHLLDAQKTLEGLSQRFRVRAQTPAEQFQHMKDVEDRDAERLADEQARKNWAAYVDSPASAMLKKADEKGMPEVGKQSALQGKMLANAQLAILEKDLSKIGDEALRRKALVQFVEGVKSLPHGAIDLSSKEYIENLNKVVDKAFSGDKSQDTYGATKAQAGSKEDKERIATARNTPEKDLTPEQIFRERRIEEANSEYMSGEQESGLVPEEDELLQLYLSRLRDPESPGEVTQAEIDDDPRLEQAAEVYNKAATTGAYKKSMAEWFSAEYLGALRTQGMLEKEVREGLPYEDPYKEAQRRALKRGGYTPEEIMLMKYRGTPMEGMVRPSYARLREDMAPRDNMEREVEELYAQTGGKLGISQLEAMLEDKRKEGVMKARKGKTEGKEGRKALRGEKRDLATEYSMESIEAAKTYLVALRLDAAGSKENADRIVAPPPTEEQVRMADPVERAKASTAIKAREARAAAVQRMADLQARTPVGDNVDLSGIDLSGDLSGVVDLNPTPDPTNPRYAYLAQPDGSYRVFVDGQETKNPAPAGSRPAQSIASALAGQGALKPRAPRTPAPPAPPAPPVFSYPGMPEVPPAGSGPPAPSPTSKTARDMSDEELAEYLRSQGGM